MKPLDAWSLLHVASGAALGVMRAPWWAILGALVGFEVFEAALRERREGGGLFEPESVANIAADVGVGVAGALIGDLFTRSAKAVL